MNIIINGQPQTTQATTIAELVAALSLNTSQVAIERNREIVSRSRYAQVMVNAGDEIEIVSFIGGG